MSEQISQLHQAVSTIMRALKVADTKAQSAHREFSFAPAEVQSLRFVAQNSGCKLTELASHLGVALTTASSIVDRLVDRGFVRRDRQETNRRAVALDLTKDGSEAFGRIEIEEFQMMQLMLEALPEHEREKFVSSMRQIANHVSRSE